MNAWRSLKWSKAQKDEPQEVSLIMDWRSPRNLWWIRIVAYFIIIAFLNQDIVWAQGGTPTWLTKTVSKEVPGTFSVPKDVAVTREVYNSSQRTTEDGRRKTIINIQDAHASLTAQESISSILDSLVTNYDLKLVAIEGSSGYIDTSILKTFPDESIRKDTAKDLMARGKMSAGEFFSITSNKPVKLYGIEDKDLYLENVDQFRKVYELNQKVKTDIVNLLKTLEALKGKIYSEDLKRLESNSVLHQDGKLLFTDRWVFASALAKKHGLDYSGYVNLSKLVESLKLEKGINFEKANRERDALIDTLSKKLAKPELEELVLRSLSFKSNKISQGEYYMFLHALSEKNGVDPEPYKNLIAYTGYIALYESIDLLEIFSEAKDFEDAIKEKIYTSPDQKKLCEISTCVGHIKDLFELKLTNGEFEYLEKTIKNYDAEKIEGFVRGLEGDIGAKGAAGYDLDNIFSNIPIAMEFYKTAEKRNNIMLANTIKAMDREGQTIAAVVTGGYHTKGLSELLRRKETSYLVILPKFDASKGQRPYVAILTNKKAPYEPLLNSGQYYLATSAYFEGLTRNADPKKLAACYGDEFLGMIAKSVTDTSDPAKAKENLEAMMKSNPGRVSERCRSLIDRWLAGYRRDYGESDKKDKALKPEEVEKFLYYLVQTMDIDITAKPEEARLVEIEERLKRLEESMAGAGESRQARIDRAVERTVAAIVENPSKSPDLRNLLKRSLKARDVILQDAEFEGLIPEAERRLPKAAPAKIGIGEKAEMPERMSRGERRAYIAGELKKAKTMTVTAALNLSKIKKEGFSRSTIYSDLEFLTKEGVVEAVKSRGKATIYKAKVVKKGKGGAAPQELAVPAPIAPQQEAAAPLPAALLETPAPKPAVAQTPPARGPPIADTASRLAAYSIAAAIILSLFFVWQPASLISAVGSFEWLIGTVVTHTSLTPFGLILSAGKIMAGLALFETMSMPLRLGVKRLLKWFGFGETIPAIDLTSTKDDILKAFELRFGIKPEEGLDGLDKRQLLRAYKLTEKTWFDTIDTLIAASHKEKMGIALNFLNDLFNPIKLLNVIYGFYPAFYWKDLRRSYKAHRLGANLTDLTENQKKLAAKLKLVKTEAGAEITGKALALDIFKRSVLPNVSNQKTIASKIWQSKLGVLAALWSDSIFIKGTLKFFKARLGLAIASGIGHFLILGPLAAMFNLDSAWFADYINELVLKGTISSAASDHAIAGIGLIPLAPLLGEFLKAGIGRQFTMSAVIGSFSTVIMLRFWAIIKGVCGDYRHGDNVRMSKYFNRAAAAQVLMGTWGMWFVGIEIPMILGQAASADAVLFGGDRTYIHDTLALVEGHEGAIGVGNTILDRVLGVFGFGMTQRVLSSETDNMPRAEKAAAPEKAITEPTEAFPEKEQELNRVETLAPPEIIIEKQAPRLPEGLPALETLPAPITLPAPEIKAELPLREIERKPVPPVESPLHFIGDLKYERAGAEGAQKNIWYVSKSGKRLEMRFGAVFENDELKTKGALSARIGYAYVIGKSGEKKTYTYIKYTGDPAVKENFRGKAFVRDPDGEIYKIVPDTINIDNGIVTGNPLFIYRGRPVKFSGVLEPSLTLNSFASFKCNKAIDVEEGSRVTEAWAASSGKAVRRSYLYKDKTGKNILSLSADSRYPDRVFIGRAFWPNGNVKKEEAWVARLNKNNAGIAPVAGKVAYRAEERVYDENGALAIKRSDFDMTVTGVERAGKTCFTLFFDSAGRPVLTSDFTAPNVNFAGKQTFTIYSYDEDGNVIDKKISDEFPASLRNEIVRGDSKALYGHLAKYAGDEMREYLSTDAIIGLCSSIYRVIDNNLPMPNDMLLPDDVHPVFEGINEKLDEAVKMQDSGRIEIPEEFEIYARGTLTPIQCYELERAHPGILGALGASIYINLYGVDAAGGIKNPRVIKHWDKLIAYMKAHKAGELNEANWEAFKYELSGNIASTMCGVHRTQFILAETKVDKQTGAMSRKLVPTFGQGGPALIERQRLDSVSPVISFLVGRALNPDDYVDSEALRTGVSFQNLEGLSARQMEKMAGPAGMFKPVILLFRDLSRLQAKLDLQRFKTYWKVTNHFNNDRTARIMAAQDQYKVKLREAEQRRAVWMEKLRRDAKYVGIKYQSYINKEKWYALQSGEQMTTSRMFDPDSYVNGLEALYYNMRELEIARSRLSILKLEMSKEEEYGRLDLQALEIDQKYVEEKKEAYRYYSEALAEITPQCTVENIRRALHTADDQLLPEQEDLFNLLTAMSLFFETRYNKPLAEILEKEDHDKLMSEASMAAKMLPSIVESMEKSDRSLIVKFIYGRKPRADGRVDVMGEAFSFIDQHVIVRGNQLLKYDDEWNKVVQVITWDGEKNVWRVEHTTDNPESPGRVFIFDIDRKAPICEIIPAAPGNTETKFFIRDKDGVVIGEKTTAVIDGEEKVLEEVDKSEPGKEKIKTGDFPQKDAIDRKILELYKEMYKNLRGDGKLGEEKAKKEFRKHWYEWNEYRDKVLKQLEATAAPASAQTPSAKPGVEAAKISISAEVLKNAPIVNIDGIPNWVILGPGGRPIMYIPVTDIIRGEPAKSPAAADEEKFMDLSGVSFHSVALDGSHYGANLGMVTGRGVHMGFSSAEGRNDLEQRFGMLSREGVKTVRIFLFSDLRGGIRFDSSGNPEGLTPFVNEDMQALLDTAAKYNIKLILPLFDFHLADKIAGNQEGERPDLIKDQAKREGLRKILAPFLQKFGKHPNIIAWEGMNEPELAAAVSDDEMKIFLSDIAQELRAAGKSVTFSAHTVSDLEKWKNLAKPGDIIQLHWYDSVDNLPAKANLAVPRGIKVVIGELGYEENQNKDISDILKKVRELGYDGACFWIDKDHQKVISDIGKYPGKKSQAPTAPAPTSVPGPSNIPNINPGLAENALWAAATEITRMPNSLIARKTTGDESYLFLYDNPEDPRRMAVTSDKMKNEKGEQVFAVYKVENIKTAVKDKYGRIVKDANGNPKIEVRIVEEGTIQVEMRKSIEANMNTHTITAMGEGVSDTGKKPGDPIRLYVRNAGEDKVYVINELIPEFPPDVIDGANVTIKDGVVTVTGAENYLERYRLDAANNAIVKDVTSGKEKGTYLFDLEIYRAHGKWLLIEKTDADGAHYTFGYDNRVNPKIRIVQKTGAPLNISYVSKLAFNKDEAVDESLTELVGMRYGLIIPKDHRVDPLGGKPYAEVITRGNNRYTSYANESYVPENLRGKIFRADKTTPWQSDTLMDSIDGAITVRYFYDKPGDEDNPGRLIFERDYIKGKEKSIDYDGDTRRVSRIKETALDENRNPLPGTTRIFEYDTQTGVLLLDKADMQMGRISRITEPDNRVSTECYFTPEGVLMIAKDTDIRGKILPAKTIYVPTGLNGSLDKSRPFRTYKGEARSIDELASSTLLGELKLTKEPEQGNAIIKEQAWNAWRCLGIIFAEKDADRIREEIFSHIGRAIYNDHAQSITPDRDGPLACKVLELEIWGEADNMVKDAREAKRLGRFNPDSFRTRGKLLLTMFESFKRLSLEELVKAKGRSQDHYNNVKYVWNGILNKIEAAGLEEAYLVLNPHRTVIDLNSDGIRKLQDNESRAGESKLVLNVAENFNISGNFVDMSHRELILRIRGRVTSPIMIIAVDDNGNEISIEADIEGHAFLDRYSEEDKKDFTEHRIKLVPSSRDERTRITKKEIKPPLNYKRIVCFKVENEDLAHFDFENVRIEDRHGGRDETGDGKNIALTQDALDAALNKPLEKTPAGFELARKVSKRAPWITGDKPEALISFLLAVEESKPVDVSGKAYRIRYQLPENCRREGIPVTLSFGDNSNSAGSYSVKDIKTLEDGWVDTTVTFPKEIPEDCDLRSMQFLQLRFQLPETAPTIGQSILLVMALALLHLLTAFGARLIDYLEKPSDKIWGSKIILFIIWPFRMLLQKFTKKPAAKEAVKPAVSEEKPVPEKTSAALPAAKPAAPEPISDEAILEAMAVAVDDINDFVDKIGVDLRQEGSQQEDGTKFYGRIFFPRMRKNEVWASYDSSVTPRYNIDIIKRSAIFVVASAAIYFGVPWLGHFSFDAYPGLIHALPYLALIMITALLNWVRRSKALMIAAVFLATQVFMAEFCPIPPLYYTSLALTAVVIFIYLSGLFTRYYKAMSNPHELIRNQRKQAELARSILLLLRDGDETLKAAVEAIDTDRVKDVKEFIDQILVYPGLSDTAKEYVDIKKNVFIDDVNFNLKDEKDPAAKKQLQKKLLGKLKRRLLALSKMGSVLTPEIMNNLTRPLRSRNLPGWEERQYPGGMVGRTAKYEQIINAAIVKKEELINMCNERLNTDFNPTIRFWGAVFLVPGAIIAASFIVAGLLHLVALPIAIIGAPAVIVISLAAFAFIIGINAKAMTVIYPARDMRAIFKDYQKLIYSADTAANLGIIEIRRFLVQARSGLGQMMEKYPGEGYKHLQEGLDSEEVPMLVVSNTETNRDFMSAFRLTALERWPRKISMFLKIAAVIFALGAAAHLLVVLWIAGAREYVQVLGGQDILSWSQLFDRPFGIVKIGEALVKGYWWDAAYWLPMAFTQAVFQISMIGSFVLFWSKYGPFYFVGQYTKTYKEDKVVTVKKLSFYGSVFIGSAVFLATVIMCGPVVSMAAGSIFGAYANPVLVVMSMLSGVSLVYSAMLLVVLQSAKDKYRAICEDDVLTDARVKKDGTLDIRGNTLNIVEAERRKIGNWAREVELSINKFVERVMGEIEDADYAVIKEANDAYRTYGDNWKEHMTSDPDGLTAHEKVMWYEKKFGSGDKPSGVDYEGLDSANPADRLKAIEGAYQKLTRDQIVFRMSGAGFNELKKEHRRDYSALFDMDSIDIEFVKRHPGILNTEDMDEDEAERLLAELNTMTPVDFENLKTTIPDLIDCSKIALWDVQAKPSVIRLTADELRAFMDTSANERKIVLMYDFLSRFPPWIVVVGGADAIFKLINALLCFRYPLNKTKFIFAGENWDREIQDAVRERKKAGDYPPQLIFRGMAIREDGRPATPVPDSIKNSNRFVRPFKLLYWWIFIRKPAEAAQAFTKPGANTGALVPKISDDVEGISDGRAGIIYDAENIPNPNQILQLILGTMDGVAKLRHLNETYFKPKLEGETSSWKAIDDNDDIDTVVEKTLASVTDMARIYTREVNSNEDDISLTHRFNFKTGSILELQLAYFARHTLRTLLEVTCGLEGGKLINIATAMMRGEIEKYLDDGVARTRKERKERARKRKEALQLYISIANAPGSGLARDLYIKGKITKDEFIKRLVIAEFRRINEPRNGQGRLVKINSALHRAQGQVAAFMYGEYASWYPIGWAGLHGSADTFKPLGGTTGYFCTEPVEEIDWKDPEIVRRLGLDKKETIKFHGKDIEVTPAEIIERHYKITNKLLTVGGWDEYQVAEDYMLGFVMWLYGFNVAGFLSLTPEDQGGFESFLSFMFRPKQMSRWIKGYIIGLLVFVENIPEIYERKGLWGIFVFLVPTLSSAISPLTFQVAKVLSLSWIIHFIPLDKIGEAIMASRLAPYANWFNNHVPIGTFINDVQDKVNDLVPSILCMFPIGWIWGIGPFIVGIPIFFHRFFTILGIIKGADDYLGRQRILEEYDEMIDDLINGKDKIKGLRKEIRALKDPGLIAQLKVLRNKIDEFREMVDEEGDHAAPIIDEIENIKEMLKAKDAAFIIVLLDTMEHVIRIREVVRTGELIEISGVVSPRRFVMGIGFYMGALIGFILSLGFLSPLAVYISYGAWALIAIAAFMVWFKPYITKAPQTAPALEESPLSINHKLLITVGLGILAMFSAQFDVAVFTVITFISATAIYRILMGRSEKYIRDAKDVRQRSVRAIRVRTVWPNFFITEYHMNYLGANRQAWGETMNGGKLGYWWRTPRTVAILAQMVEKQKAKLLKAGSKEESDYLDKTFKEMFNEKATEKGADGRKSLMDRRQGLQLWRSYGFMVIVVLMTGLGLRYDIQSFLFGRMLTEITHKATTPFVISNSQIIALVAPILIILLGFLVLKAVKSIKTANVVKSSSTHDLEPVKSVGVLIMGGLMALIGYAVGIDAGLSLSFGFGLAAAGFLVEARRHVKVRNDIRNLNSDRIGDGWISDVALDEISALGDVLAELRREGIDIDAKKVTPLTWDAARMPDNEFTAYLELLRTSPPVIAKSSEENGTIQIAPSLLKPKNRTYLKQILRHEFAHLGGAGEIGATRAERGIFGLRFIYNLLPLLFKKQPPLPERPSPASNTAAEFARRFMMHDGQPGFSISRMISDYDKIVRSGYPRIPMLERGVIGLIEDTMARNRAAGRTTTRYMDACGGIGCAANEAAARYGSHGLESYMVDIKEWMPADIPSEIVSWIRGRGRLQGIDDIFARKHHFQKADITDVKLPAKMDVITNMASLQYLNDPIRALVNLYNQLEIGGVLITSYAVFAEDKPVFRGFYEALDALAKDFGATIFTKETQPPGEAEWVLCICIVKNNDMDAILNAPLAQVRNVHPILGYPDMVEKAAYYGSVVLLPAAATTVVPARGAPVELTQAADALRRMHQISIEATDGSNFTFIYQEKPALEYGPDAFRIKVCDSRRNDAGYIDVYGNLISTSFDSRWESTAYDAIEVKESYRRRYTGIGRALMLLAMSIASSRKYPDFIARRPRAAENNKFYFELGFEVKPDESEIEQPSLVFKFSEKALPAEIQIERLATPRVSQPVSPETEKAAAAEAAPQSISVWNRPWVKTMIIAGIIAAVAAGLAVILYYLAPNVINFVRENKKGVTLGSYMTSAGLAAARFRKIINFTDLSKKGHKEVMGKEAPQPAEPSEEMTVLGQILAEFPGIENNINKLRRAMIKALKQPEFIVGISQNASPKMEETLRASLGIGARIVRAENAAAFESLTCHSRIPAILIDESVTLEEISKPEFTDSVTALVLNLNEFTIHNKTRRELQWLLREIKENLMKMERRDIDEDIRLALEENNAKHINRVKEIVRKRKSGLAPVYNREKINPAKFYGRRIAIATTERVASYDMYTFDNMKAAESQGITNYFIYGDIYKTENEAGQFARACGYKGDINDIRFIDKRNYPSYAALVSAIRQDTKSSFGIDNANIGVRATAEDGLLNENEKVEAGTYLEVQPVEVGGEPVYMAFNSYQVLLKIMAELEREGMTLEKITIPGVTIDSVKGILKYLPKILPIDYTREIDLYRKAIEFIRTAA
ncbi:MAG: cellulase family glycosylhydrolase [Candidatus Omnitrophota bacterium]